ncbi:MAG: leucyl/phenylalanyl-tRNA--protein transferase [Bdellovibrionota bacterium]
MSQKLTTEILVSAYCQGYFPMPDDKTGEILWFRPELRAVIPLNAFHVSRSLRKALNKKTYHVTINQEFALVMDLCSQRQETWINDEIKASYFQLFKRNFAHSLEIWQGSEIIGGLYGVAIRGAFFAESMFHRKTNGSKIALYHLTEHLKANGYLLLECQFLTNHLASLGAIEITDKEYLERLEEALKVSPSFT